ncbi:hypothetical protein BN1708_011873 [Verticillium longisporum]|uniref:Uncharacterized protein n=1 Tax=Verticillium longisporum TaxID=100787 RepID=A0A0G4L4M1_VERLO|nr:hypothetical protein BN1708_011873 [Verticillium longisporum]
MPRRGHGMMAFHPSSFWFSLRCLLRAVAPGTVTRTKGNEWRPQPRRDSRPDHGQITPVNCGLWAADLVPAFILGIAFTLKGAYCHSRVAVPEQGPGSVRCTQYYSLVSNPGLEYPLPWHPATGATRGTISHPHTPNFRLDV